MIVHLGGNVWLRVDDDRKSITLSITVEDPDGTREYWAKIPMELNTIHRGHCGLHMPINPDPNVHYDGVRNE